MTPTSPNLLLVPVLVGQEAIDLLLWVQMNGLAKGKTTMYAVPFIFVIGFGRSFLTQKEVERRRRGNINEGINELGRIVPNSSGEKAKGAILARAVQYIHHLKENEARNIEKWTLEKLLMDQAMGDLQAQLEEVRRLWEEERGARQRAESELEVLRGVSQSGVPLVVGAPPRPSSQSGQPNYRSRSRSAEQQEGVARENEARTEAEARPEEDGNIEPDGRPGKRPRVD